MRRRSVLLGTLALLLPIGLTAVPQSGAAAAPPPGFAAQTVRDWERASMAVVYDAALGATPIPLGVPRLGYVSLAMHHAVMESLDRRRSSEAAAAAYAAHDVLVAEYGHLAPVVTFLADRLDATMDQLPDTAATDRGTMIGKATAAAMIADRADDGLDRTDVVYDKPPGAGVWQPAPGGSMAAAQLGFVDPLVLRRRQMVEVDGPDPLGSAEYVRDYREVRSLGRDDSTARGAWQTETAQFFNFNSATMVGSAVLDLLDARPLGVRRTALLFARMHGAMTDSVINAWRLKYEVGFWRPAEAIDGAFDDGDPATEEEEGWLPLLPTPSYSDYVSGHGSLTAPAIETVRRMLGERTSLTLVNPVMGLERTYKRLSKIERQASHSRIWGGLHFRDAMDDAYLLGHRTARRVLAELR